MKLLRVAVMAAAVLIAPLAIAQETAADNTEIVFDKVRADKRLLVASNMNLSEGEAKAFWPVYDAYQADLQKINGRIDAAVTSFAEAYNTGVVPDAMAKELIDEMLAIETAEVDLKKSYVPKLSKALSTAKVARYMQIEPKLRAALKFEMSKAIPLVI